MAVDFKKSELSQTYQDIVNPLFRIYTTDEVDVEE